MVEICTRMQEDEFLDFYNMYSAVVTRLAGYLLGDEREALGVTDNTMWYAFCHPEKFRGRDETSVVAYLLKIARARSIDLIRHNSRTSCDFIDTFEYLSYESWRESVEGCIESCELSSVIGRCIGTMSDIYRETVLLRLFDGMTLPEISERLHIPLDTAKSRWRRGRMILRESISRYLL